MTKQSYSSPLGSSDPIPLGGAGSGNWGHAGRKGQRGGSMPQSSAMSIEKGRTAKDRQKLSKVDGLSSVNRTRLLTYRELHNRDETEKAVTFDKDGKVTWSAVGEKNYVKVPQEVQPRIKDTVFVHNHPAGWGYDMDDPRAAGNSFSLEDILLAVHADVAEMVAVSPIYVHRMLRPEGGWPDLETAKAAIIAADKKTYTNLWMLVNDNRLTFEQANARHAHDRAEAFSKATGIQYARESYYARYHD